MSIKKIDNIVILAGGESRRFWPLKEKLLFKFLGKELILHQVEKFKVFGRNLVLVVNEYLKERLKFLEQQKIRLVVQSKKYKGQAGALSNVISSLVGEVLIVNGNDIFENKDIKGFLQNIGKYKLDGQLAFVKVQSYFPGGYLKFDENGKVVKIIEKPEEGNEPSNCVRAVLDYFSKVSILQKALERVKQFDYDEQYEQAINLILPQKIFKTYLLRSGFLSLKYPWHILSATQFFLKKIKKSVFKSKKIGKGTIIEGKVIIEEGVKIGNFCKLKGPLYIGKNSIVGDYSLIRESHIGENCVIGSHSEVARSYFSDSVWIHRNYVGDSVLGKNVMIGAGTITANFRLDSNTVLSKVKGERINTNLIKLGAILGENTKIGSGVILLPGVKVGKGSFVGPGEIIKNDVEEGKFVFQNKYVKNKITRQ